MRVCVKSSMSSDVNFQKVKVFNLQCRLMIWPSQQKYVNPVCTWWLVLFQLLSFYINSPPSLPCTVWFLFHTFGWYFHPFPFFLNLYCFCSFQDLPCIPHGTHLFWLSCLFSCTFISLFQNCSIHGGMLPNPKENEMGTLPQAYNTYFS